MSPANQEDPLTRDDGSPVSAEHVEEVRDRARLDAETIMADPDASTPAEGLGDRRVEGEST